MEKSLAKNNLFGIKKTTSQTFNSTGSVNVPITQHNNRTIEKALLEAEHKKAQAITISRRYNFR